MIKRISNKNRRKSRVRNKISNISARPRLSIFRSNRYLYAQIIDDSKGITLASISSLTEKKTKEAKKGEWAKQLGKILAEKAAKQKVKKVVFDRSCYKYHGVVKALAEGAREGGLNF